MREVTARQIAYEVRKYLTDGRPPGCSCPPNPGFPTRRGDNLPCDQRHIGASTCPLTVAAGRAREPDDAPPRPSAFFLDARGGFVKCEINADHEIAVYQAPHERWAVMCLDCEGDVWSYLYDVRAKAGPC